MLERARHARLLRILLVYLGASFAVLEAIDLLGDKLGLPAWVFSGAVVLLLIGLPIIIATSLIQASGPVAVDSAVGVSSGQRPQATRRLFTWRNAITGGVVAFALWGAAVAGWMLFGPDAGAASGGETEISSLAVLPFADMSPDGSAEYLGDGVAETLIDALTKVEGLRVAARTSAFSFKGKNEDIRTIGEQLNVNAVLEGSVQTAGNRVRITAQLIEVEDGFHLWSQVYESELEDVFAVQDEVARSVV
jgi:TolB-like protein